MPDGWLARAASATAAVAAGDDPNDHAAVWRELKDGLAELFNDKCWYCEVPVPRSDNAVDHFRPKGRVSDAATEHHGYRWLAFDPANFRYACTYCNSKRKDLEGRTVGGKADRFPLVDESARLYDADGPDRERPILLDPCDIEDWRLLGCRRENGKPCASTSAPGQVARADASIEIYHLHHEPTCKLRHGEAVRLMGYIEEAKSYFALAETNADHARFFKVAAQRILKAIHIDSPFSGDMRFLLGGERSAEHPWIQTLLET